MSSKLLVVNTTPLEAESTNCLAIEGFETVAIIV